MSFSSSIRDAVSEINSNPRLRVGVWIILIIGGIYGLLVFSDHLREIKADYAGKMQQFARLKGISEQPLWPDRAMAATAAKVQFESSLWKANSKGLARASVQNWLNNQLRKCQIAKVQTQIKETVGINGYPGIWQVSATIEAAFSLDGFLKLLQIIEKDNAVVVEQLDIILHRRKKFIMGLKIYFRANSL